MSASVFSQKEKVTIFFNDGVSIEGYGFIKKNKVKFRISLDEKGEFWDYNDIQKVEYQTFHGVRTFEYVQLNGFKKPVIVEIQVRGIVSLYSIRDTFWVSHSSFSENKPGHSYKKEVITYYLLKNEDDLQTCINCGVFNKWKKNTLNFLPNCPGLTKKIKSNEFRESDIKEIVEYYNDFCTEID